MAFEISEICDPVVEPLVRGRKSPFALAVEALPVGKAVIVGGMTQGNAGSRARIIGRTMHPLRTFTTTRLDDGRIQIVRTA
jgi:hypothetical protein